MGPPIIKLFSFGMDPILDYLQKRLKGILIHSIPRQGLLPQDPPQRSAPAPNIAPTPPPGPAPAPLQPPNLPGLPILSLPPITHPRPPTTHRLQVMIPLETRYILYACDDLKPAITSRWEFIIVESRLANQSLKLGLHCRNPACSSQQIPKTP